MIRGRCLFFKIGDRRSEVRVKLSLSRKTWQDNCRQATDGTISFRILQWGTIHQIIRWRCLLFFKVVGQRWRSYCHIVGKRCSQDTEWTVSSTIIQLGMSALFVFQDRRSKVKVKLSHRESGTISELAVIGAFCRCTMTEKQMRHNIFFSLFFFTPKM